MDRNMRLIAILLLTLLLTTAEMGGPEFAEARTCESQSHRFKGACISKTNCASVCKSEGFPGGKCRGLGRRCYCVKHC